MVTVKINSKREKFPKGTSIHHMIQQKNIPTSGIAIAINQQVINRTLWEDTFLQENDSVIIIKATQGG
ncbi:sulfur carrier protein ThiS [Flavobacteriaceae bacterium Ap0902]|nr:sulfur carrier protein ThiS [Flavobacteriaceae bacterium Ap0902]